MAKTKISEFDTNPDLNTDINSINIAEGCSPANINNAIRQLMADLKEWQNGSQDRYVAPAGTAAAPSWTFNGDLDTGFYSGGANVVGVSVNGVSVGTFTSAGFVGNVTGNVTGDLTGNLVAASPTAPTQAVGTNNTTVATTAFVQAALNALYPVGSIYINATNSTNPGTLLGFGTWTAFGAGRVPVGFNASDPLFDAAEETGGSKDAIVVSHTHTYSATTGNQSADHTHSATTDNPGNFITGTVGSDTSNSSGIFASPSGVFSVSDGNEKFLDFGGTSAPTRYRAFSITAGSHTHSLTTSGVSVNHTHDVSGTTASAGSSDGTNANLQPYITVYMWKRTA
jgi:hypothetical protein